MGMIIKGPPSQGYHHFPYSFGLSFRCYPGTKKNIQNPSKATIFLQGSKQLIYLGNGYNYHTPLSLSLYIYMYIHRS